MKTMKITTFEETYGHPLTIGELVKGFKENTTTGEVTSMNGLLNIRPPYQRESSFMNSLAETRSSRPFSKAVH